MKCPKCKKEMILKKYTTPTQANFWGSTVNITVEFWACIDCKYAVIAEDEQQTLCG